MSAQACPVPRGGRAACQEQPGRLAQVDAMRVITCCSVVCVHVVANVSPAGSLPANGVAGLLHYSRQVFFFVSALVLVHAHPPGRRPAGRPGPVAVCRRRLAVIGWPYLFWGTGYAALGLACAYSPAALRAFPRTLLAGLLTGTAGYHLYFLLVSLEFTVVLPLYLRLLHATAARPGRLLAGSALLQLATLAWYHGGHLPEHGWRALGGECSLLAYQFWLVAGGVVAMRLDRFHAVALRRRRWVGAAAVVAGGAVVAAYVAGIRGGASAQHAASSLQPVVLPWAASAVLVVYLAGVRLAASRRVWTARLLRRGAHLSFGIYLVHPAILVGLLVLVGAPVHGPAAVVVTAGAIPVTLGLSWCAAAVLIRTRFGAAVAGRPVRPSRGRSRNGAAAPGGGGHVPEPAAGVAPGGGHVPEPAAGAACAPRRA